MPPSIYPAAGLLAGAAVATGLQWGSGAWTVLLILAGLATGIGQRRAPRRVAPACCLLAFAGGGLLADRAVERALHPSLRTVLDRQIGGMDIEAVDAVRAHDPIYTRITLIEDAAVGEEFTSLRAEVVAVRTSQDWEAAEGGVSLSVAGRVSAAQADAWLAGRRLELPVTFRRPARFLNDGVPDLERSLALDGTALFGSVKSGLLIDVVQRGGWIDELAARARQQTRRAVARWVGPHDGVSAAIVTAILIGDRTGLPDTVRLRLQEAGTYHVIAISGGNIAILAALVAGTLMLLGGGPRVAAAGTIIALAIYAQIAIGGPSVWRATVMALMYLAARLLDHRSPPWHATAVAAAVVVISRPLEVRDAGFLLTFGATAALLHVARLLEGYRHAPAGIRWVGGAVAASVAAEIVLGPIAAAVFSRITAAGIVLNLVAVPVMTITQFAGLALVCAPSDAMAYAAGWLAHAGAWMLVESGRLVEIAPWLTRRVPPPAPALIAVYYASVLVVLWRDGRMRLAAAATWLLSALCIVIGIDIQIPAATTPPGGVRLTMMDVGQAEALLLELPDRSSVAIDSGGAPFGGGAFDIGGRVLAPSLWARGIRRVGALLITHADPDHIGGAAALLDAVPAGEVWTGVPVPASLPLAGLRAAATREGIPLRQLRAGASWTAGPARLRVLHPPEPDWERARVRNDDSVVLEVVHGDVAVLLTGDISAATERQILPLLTPARVRVLKVAHHGSRTSTSAELVEHWRPQLALVSAGRGNRFGHPAREVIARLRSVGADLYRTDQHGQITLTSDGKRVVVRTFVGGEP